MTVSLSYAQALWQRAERRPDSELVRTAGEAPWTATRTRQCAASWALELAATVDSGDVVASCLDAGPEAVALTAAISAIGAVELPVNPALPVDGAVDLLRTTRTQVVVCSTSRAHSDLVRCLVDHLDPRLLLVDGPTPLRSNHPDRDGFIPMDLPREAPALIVSTSGTTGRPKAALLPVGAPSRQAQHVASTMAYDRDDVLLSLFPWHHINARNAAVLPAIISDSRVVFASFSASHFWELVHHENITAFNFMGAVCMMLMGRPVSSLDRGHRLSRAYGGPAPSDLVSAFAERFGVVLRQAYACTELGEIAATPPDALRAGAAGRPLPDRKVRIVDECSHDVEDGGVGEILVRPSRRDDVLLEYLDDPTATTTAWTGDWFRTRDRGYLSDGWLYVTSRTSDVIRRRGVNLDPQRIEQTLQSHPAVADAAAVGVASALTEDEVLAVVVPEVDQDPTPEELWRHCVQHLPRESVPRYLSLESGLPHTQTHKLDRAALRRRGLPKSTWDADSSRPPMEHP